MPTPLRPPLPMREPPLNRKELEALGFAGFVTFNDLRGGALADVPEAEGVYVVVRTRKQAPVFRETSRGGWFKGQDPTVAVSTLERKWMADAEVVYIGKASVNAKGKRGLRTRLREYASYGAGKPIGHRGGRYIWQLEEDETLVVAWCESDVDSAAGSDEIKLVSTFRQRYDGRLPFANIASLGA